MHLCCAYCLLHSPCIVVIACVLRFADRCKQRANNEQRSESKEQSNEQRAVHGNTDNARQQSNRSVSDSLIWQKLAGCRYLTGGINLDVSETTNWIHRSRYLNKKSKQEFIKRWLKYRSNKNAETQMTTWYGSSRLRGLRNIQSNSLPPQGKGPQDSGVWRLRRTRFKNTRRQLHGYNLYSEKK